MYPLPPWKPPVSIETIGEVRSFSVNSHSKSPTKNGYVAQEVLFWIESQSATTYFLGSTCFYTKKGRLRINLPKLKSQDSKPQFISLEISNGDK